MLITFLTIAGCMAAFWLLVEAVCWWDDRADLQARRAPPPVETGPCVECGQLQPWPQGKIKCTHCGAALYYWP